MSTLRGGSCALNVTGVRSVSTSGRRGPAKNVEEVRFVNICVRGTHADNVMGIAYASTIGSGVSVKIVTEEVFANIRI